MGTKVFASANNYFAVTKSDTTLVSCKAIYIGTGGDIAITPSLGGTAVTFKNMNSGTILPVEIKGGNIRSTNTTAADIVALNW
jgi:hypothetical protein